MGNLLCVVNPVQSHLLWIDDPEILKQLPGHQSTSTYIESLLDGSRQFPFNDDMEELSRCDHVGDNNVHANFRDISALLSLSAMWAYTENHEESLKWLQKAEILVNRFVDIRQGHRLVLDYCIETLRWSLLQKSGEFLRKEKVDELKAKWGEMAMRNEKESQAVVQYLKARLSEFFMVPLEKVLEKMQNVVEIEPDYHEWHQAVYLIRRKIRRNVKRNHDKGGMPLPCEKEREACRNAYDLAPNNFQCLYDVALLIQEGLWTLDASEWDKQEDDYLLCLQLFREVINITTEKRLTRYVFKTKVMLAEFVLFGRGSKLGKFQNEGKALLDECETICRNTNSYSFVIRKLAKLHHYGANGKKRFRDIELAKTCYRKSLSEGHHNFACLMDYLKLVKTEVSKLKSSIDGRKMYQEILEEFWKCRELTTFPNHLATLSINEGCILWIFNPWDDKEDDRKVKACRVWLQVFSNWPDFSESLLRAIEKPPFYLEWDKPAEVPILMLIDTLESMKRAKQSNTSREHLETHIITFIEGLRVIQQKNQNQTGW